MPLQVSNGLKNVMLTPLPTWFGGGVIYLYSGTQPDRAEYAPTGTLLAMITTNGLAYTLGSTTNGLHFSSTTGGFITNDPAYPWVIQGVATGTCGWGRLMTYQDNLLASSSLPRLDMPVNEDGTSGGIYMISAAVTPSYSHVVESWLYGIPPF